MKKVFPESFPRIRILKKTTELLFLANLCNIRTYVRMYIRVYYLSNLLTKNISNPTGQYTTVPYKKKPKKSIFAGYPSSRTFKNYQYPYFRKKNLIRSSFPQFLNEKIILNNVSENDIPYLIAKLCEFHQVLVRYCNLSSRENNQE